METKTHLPKWFKAAVAQGEGLGKGKAGRAAWEAIERHLGPCQAGSSTLDGGEALRINIRVPPATARERIPWDKVDGFRARYGLGPASIHFESVEGRSVCRLDFLPQKA